jgi:hypothetical protein
MACHAQSLPHCCRSPHPPAWPAGRQQIAALALRSGNGLLLKGGKEAARSNAILHKTIVDAVGGLGPDLIHLVTSRDEIAGVLSLSGWWRWGVELGLEASGPALGRAQKLACETLSSVA